MCQRLLSRAVEERDAARKHNPAIFIQSFVRSTRSRNEMVSLRQAVVQVDHERRLDMLLSLLSTFDLVYLTRFQALFRGMLVRKEYRGAYASAVCIQKQWKYKSDPEVVAYSTYFKSILTVQKKFKRYYSLRKSAAKKIQLSHLSRRMRRNLSEVHRSVNLIQRAVRGHRARCFIQRMKAIRHQSASTKIQSIVRAHRCRSELQLAGTNATKIQRCYRRFNDTFCENASLYEKKAYIDMLKSWHQEAMAIRIQTIARSRLSHLKLLQIKALTTGTEDNIDDGAALTVVGGVEPAKSATTIDISTSLNTTDASARVIQSKWRSFRCRKELLIRRNAAAFVIQSFVRSWLCRQELIGLRSKAVEAELLAKEAAAITLQAFSRSLICQKLLSNLKGQGQYAGMQRNEDRLLAATKIQSILRVYRCREELCFFSTHAEKIQRCYRYYKSTMFEKARQDEKKAYSTILKKRHQEAMAIRIQAITRSWLCKRKMSTAYLSATLIQSTWRSYRCRDELLVRRAQLEGRQFVIRSASAIIIQSVVRSGLCRRELINRKERMRVRKAAAVTIQTFARSCNARILLSRIVSTHRVMGSKSAVLIQSIVRMFLIKSRFDVANKAAYIIQHAWRRFVSSLQEKILVVSELLTVSRYSCVHRSTPMHKAKTLLPRDLKRLNRIRSITPRLPRRYECGVFIQEVMNSVAIVIQSFARRYLVFLRMKNLHQAAYCVQKSWRLRSRRRKLHAAILKIQAVTRGKLARGNVSVSLSAAVVIQYFYRNVISQRCSRIENELIVADEAEQNATIVLQRFLRVCLAKNSIMELRLERGRLLDEDNDLKRLAQYFASLRFSNKQLEEAAEMQWLEEKTRLAEEVRLENNNVIKQNETATNKEASEGSSDNLRMSTDAEIESVLKAVYQRAEAIAHETNSTTPTQCVMACETKLVHALANENTY